MLQKNAGVSDENYRALLEGYGVTSCRDMNQKDALQLIAFLGNLVPSKEDDFRKYDDLGYREDFATPAQLRMLEALWKDVSFCKISQQRHAAWREFLWNRFKIISVENISQDDVGPIKYTLESMRYAQRKKQQAKA